MSLTEKTSKLQNVRHSTFFNLQKCIMKVKERLLQNKRIKRQHNLKTTSSWIALFILRNIWQNLNSFWNRRYLCTSVNFLILMVVFWLRRRMFIGNAHEYTKKWASQVALVVKNKSANAGDVEMRVPPLVQEDPLEEGMATHSSILAWRIPWTVKPGGLQTIESQRVRHDWSNFAHMHILGNNDTSKEK